MRHTNLSDRFLNRDTRLGDAIECTIAEMIAIFRHTGWDIVEGENNSTMTDDEIIEALNTEYDLAWLG